MLESFDVFVAQFDAACAKLHKSVEQQAKAAPRKSSNAGQNGDITKDSTQSGSSSMTQTPSRRTGIRRVGSRRKNSINRI